MKTKNWWFLWLTVLVVGWLVACLPAETPGLEPDAGSVPDAGNASEQVDPTDTPEPEPTEEEMMSTPEPLSDEEKIEIRETIASSPQAEPVEPDEDGIEAEEEAPAIVGEVPAEIIANIQAEIAANNANADIGEMVVRRAEAVVFNDGSLGCPQPGEFYTMALVDGYVVEIEVDGKVYDYRVNNNGFFRLCEDGRPYAPPIGGTPDS